MEYYYTQLFKKLEKPERLLSLASVLAATGATVYAIRRMFAVDSIEFESKGAEQIPVPPGAMYYLGHIPKLGNIPAQKITEWHKQYGPILRIKMGVQDWIFVSDPEVSHNIFATQGAVTSGRPYITFGNGINGIGNRGIIFSDGKQWKNARTAILKILSPKSVDGFKDILLREAEKSVDMLVEQTKINGHIAPMDYVRLAAVNVILATAFGMPGLTSPKDPLFIEMVHIIEMGVYYTCVLGDISAYFPVLSFLDVLFRKKRKMQSFMDNSMRPFFQRLVNIARKSDKDSLVKKLDKIKEGLNIDELNITVIMSELLVAGGDTVSIATLFTYAILCHYPEVQKRLAEEIDTFIQRNKRHPTFEDRLELPYFIAVQKECMRFRSPVYYGVPRKASKDIAYRNYIIPKGVTLVSNIHRFNFNPELYPDPEEFKPERFFHDNRSIYASSNGSIQRRDLFVFGWGRRICPGIYMAENELFNSLTRMMARCTIEPLIAPNGDKIYPNLDDFSDSGSTLTPGPFKLRFIEREDRVII